MPRTLRARKSPMINLKPGYVIGPVLSRCDSSETKEPYCFFRKSILHSVICFVPYLFLAPGHGAMLCSVSLD